MKAANGLKFCPRCQETKPVAEYPRNRTTADGWAGYCKPCFRAASKSWRVSNEVRARRYRLKREYERQDHVKAIRVRSRRRTRYGIEPDEYQALSDAQGGVCALCRRPSENGRPLVVDHDHSCCGSNRGCRKCVRGLLCDRCNRHWLPTTEAVPWLQNDLSRAYLAERPLSRS